MCSCTCVMTLVIVYGAWCMMRTTATSLKNAVAEWPAMCNCISAKACALARAMRYLHVWCMTRVVMTPRKKCSWVREKRKRKIETKKNEILTKCIRQKTRKAVLFLHSSKSRRTSSIRKRITKIVGIVMIVGIGFQKLKCLLQIFLFKGRMSSPDGSGYYLPPARGKQMGLKVREAGLPSLSRPFIRRRFLLFLFASFFVLFLFYFCLFSFTLFYFPVQVFYSLRVFILFYLFLFFPIFSFSFFGFYFWG